MEEETEPETETEKEKETDCLIRKWVAKSGLTFCESDASWCQAKPAERLVGRLGCGWRRMAEIILVDDLLVGLNGH